SRGWPRCGGGTSREARSALLGLDAGVADRREPARRIVPEPRRPQPDRIDDAVLELRPVEPAQLLDILRLDLIVADMAQRGFAGEAVDRHEELQMVDARRGLPPFIHIADAAHRCRQAGLLEHLAPRRVEHAAILRLEAAARRNPPVALGPGRAMPDQQDALSVEDEPGGTNAMDHGRSHMRCIREPIYCLG